MLNKETSSIDIPNYRLHVVHKFPRLKVLDNKEITAVERKQADIVIKKEETVLGLMLSNEILINKLEKVDLANGGADLQ
jgi:hypothetical protein